MTNRVGIRGLLRACAGVGALALALAGAAAAQTSTGSIRGTVRSSEGAMAATAFVEARNTQTGFVRRTPVQQGGFYNLAGLPPGTYAIDVRGTGGETQARSIVVGVGQSLTLDLNVGARTVALQGITVVGDRAFETQTSEVATNVTRQQMEALPQGDRNFLNFAQLANGVHLSLDDQRKTVSSGGLPAEQVNVFIDGISYKNDILQGGVAGQDASRGNPFPQSAIGEFRVITENYKAEYQKAAGAVITAVTRTGGNRWEGGAFAYGQPNDFVRQDFFADQRCDQAKTAGNACAPKPDYRRWQAGVSLGGPLIKDKLHLFAAYEGNYQDRAATVFLNGGAPPAAVSQFGKYAGSFGQPFRSNLFFGKLSYQPVESHTLEFTANLRNEHETRDFGSQTSFEAATDLRNNVNTFGLKDDWTHGSLLNQASASFQRYSWNPTPLNPGLVGRDIIGTIRIGGNSTEQNFTQDRLSLRNDVTYTRAGFLGDHVFKGGANLDFLTYDVQKRLFGNPVYTYRPDSLDVPTQAQYGVGNPDLSAKNRQLGVYVQDDWSPTRRLLLNLGLRWDYETDMLNNDYVTPQALRDSLSGFVPSSYFTSGKSDRPPFYGAFQPRVGASFDVTGDKRTVVFAGFGIFYDRTFYNAIVDEKYRRQYAVRTFQFSTNGAPRNGTPTIVWRPEYGTAAGLDQLIASGSAPNPEVFLLDNNTRPPMSQQWSLGIRQAVSSWQLSATYTGVRGHNLLSWIRGNRQVDPNNPTAIPATGPCCRSLASYAAVFVSSDAKRTWYDALYLKAERPYTAASRWGATLNYTYSKATQNGRDLFSLDRPRIEDTGRYPSPGDQRHAIVATGIVGLPWDFRFSSLLSLNSGSSFTIIDATRGFGPNDIDFRGGYPDKQSFIFPDAFAYRQLDLRLEKGFTFAPRQRLAVVGEAFNVTNATNYGCFNDFIPPEGNPNVGKPNCTVGFPRRFQLGATYGF
ncbi:MAG TPA: carboxypeptidase regulatory-like domain-containing protein [Longimicrobiaceae bacterium]|nr:carboxypeptidase regulatory-like domain-containing protein [Longimicrobiaceae bacterium]